MHSYRPSSLARSSLLCRCSGAALHPRKHQSRPVHLGHPILRGWPLGKPVGGLSGRFQRLRRCKLRGRLLASPPFEARRERCLFSRCCSSRLAAGPNMERSGAPGGGVAADEVGLDGLVLGVEVGHVHHQVPDHEHVRQRRDLRHRLGVPVHLRRAAETSSRADRRRQSVLHSIWENRRLTTCGQPRATGKPASAVCTNELGAVAAAVVAAAAAAAQSCCGLTAARRCSIWRERSCLSETAPHARNFSAFLSRTEPSKQVGSRLPAKVLPAARWRVWSRTRSNVMIRPRRSATEKC